MESDLVQTKIASRVDQDMHAKIPDWQNEVIKIK